jgi:hypothetical protein
VALVSPARFGFDNMLGRKLSRADLERLVDETCGLRHERGKLLERNHELKHAPEHGWGAAGASGGSDGPDPSGAAPVHLPVENIREMLAAMDAHLESCVAAAVFAVDPTSTQHEVLHAIRSRAAVLALHCIELMLRCACAVLPSALLRVHVAALRPREAGNRDPATDAMVPAICRMCARSRLLRLCQYVLWLVGATCQYLVLFDRFESGSWQEWLGCCAGALALPANICVAASLNAKTVRQLLREFETLYVVAYVLGMLSLYLFLFQEHPAKMVALSFALPSFLLSGFQDAGGERSRVGSSRVFFSLNVAALLTLLALVSLELGIYTEYRFQVSTFTFSASSMVCNAIIALVVFGLKNIALSFYEPGSLVVLKSAVCCVFLDADALAVLEGSYSLIGQSFGKFAANKTVLEHLNKQRLSTVAFSSGSARSVTAVAVLAEQADSEDPRPANPTPHTHAHTGTGTPASLR